MKSSSEMAISKWNSNRWTSIAQPQNWNLIFWEMAKRFTANKERTQMFDQHIMTLANILSWLVAYSVLTLTNGRKLSIKPGSHLCDKHDTSEISISISTRKKEHVRFVSCITRMNVLYWLPVLHAKIATCLG